jgi:TatD DNase family protein
VLAAKQEDSAVFSALFAFTPPATCHSIRLPIVGLRLGRQSVRLFDAHCHLHDERLAARVSSLLVHASDAGIAGFLSCGSEEADWPEVDRIATDHAGVTPAFGIHPWYAKGRSPDWRNRLRQRLLAWPGAPVGEIGLDHAIAERDDADQDRLFREQLSLSIELDRPVCIHCRRAWDTLLRALRTGPCPARFMIHSFSGAAELVPPLAGLGAYFSFSGTITWSRNRRAHAALAAVPPDRLLIETDAPDLPPAPDPQTGVHAEVNEPANLRRVLTAAAERLHVEEKELAERTWENAMRFLGIGTA